MLAIMSWAGGNLFKQYYQDELEYLRQLQQDFAQQYPEHAAELNLFGDEPELRRLMQGFSFLSAHTVAGIEQSGNALMHPLMHHFWPQLLRPTPACSLIEFRPQPGILQQSSEIPKGFLLKTAQGIEPACTFQTTAAVTVYPVTLKSLDVDGTGPRQARVTLTFEVFPATQLAHEKRGPLRLQILDTMPGGETAAMALTMALRRQLSHLHMKVFVGPQLEKVVDRRLNLQQLRPLGEHDEEALFPHKTEPVAQQRHLHEWLLFPAKYRTFGFYGLERLATLQALRQFTLELTLAVDPAKLSGLSVDAIRLHCVPTINLFPNTVRLHIGEGQQAEYLLPTDNKAPHSTQIYSVDGVTGSKRAGIAYQPFMSLQPHEWDNEKSSRYFLLREAPALVPHRLESNQAAPHDTLGADENIQEHRTLYYLRIVDGKGGPSTPEGILKVSVTSCNGMATRLLKAEQLSVPVSPLDAGILFGNIGEMSEPASVPAKQAPVWSGMRLMRRGIEQLTSLNALKQMLLYYAGESAHNTPFMQRLEAILAAFEGLSSAPEGHVLGSPPGFMQGQHYKLRLKATVVEASPQLELLGEALYRHLRALAPRGRCVRLSICTHAGEPLLEWAAAEGKRALM